MGTDDIFTAFRASPAREGGGTQMARRKPPPIHPGELLRAELNELKKAVAIMREVIPASNRAA
jgi:hypothetical protein